MSARWHDLIPVAEFPADGKLATRIAGWHVLVAKTDTGFSALNDRCTHQAALLSGGRIRRGAVMCPLHGARFDAASGKCLGGTYPDLRTFALRERDGTLEIEIPDDPPGMADLPIPA